MKITNAFGFVFFAALLATSVAFAEDTTPVKTVATTASSAVEKPKQREHRHAAKKHHAKNEMKDVTGKTEKKTA